MFSVAAPALDWAQNLKKSFQIVLSNREPRMPEPAPPPGFLQHLRSWLGGLVAAAFLIITLIVAVVIGSAIAFVLWIAVVAAILVVVAVTLVRKLRRKEPSHEEPRPFIDKR